MQRILHAVKIIASIAMLLITAVSCRGAESPTELPTATQENTPTLRITLIPTNTPTLMPTTTATLLPYEGQVKLYGHVKDERGKPVEIPVAFNAFGLGDQGWVKTDSNGYYEKQVAGAIQYIVSVNPGPAKQIGRYSLPAGYLSEKKLVIRNGPEARVDFVVRDGGTLWLKAYDEFGNEMLTQDFLDSSRVGAFPIGTFPYGESIQAKYGNFPLFWGWIQNSDKNTACLLLPPGEPAVIWVLWRLPEVGTTILHADNDGKGFMVEIGDLAPINLVYEFARTEYREASQRYQELQEEGYTFSKDIANWLDMAMRNMTNAESYQQQGLENNSAVYSYKVLTNVIKARERLVLERSQQDIEKYRKGDVTLVFVDDKGNKLSNAIVEYQQVSHDFILSVSHPSSAQYKALRDAGFEYANFETWWGRIETSDGNYSFPDNEAERLERASFGIAMLSSIWPTSAYPFATPKFAAGMNPTELSSQAYQYSYDIVTHYKDKIKIYNALNEPDLPQAYKFTLDEFVGLANASALGAKKADPNIPVFVNIALPVFGHHSLDPVNFLVAYDMYGNIRTNTSVFNPPVRSGYDFAKAMVETSANIDTIGLEFYYGVVLPPIDLGIFSDTLDFYGTLGKAIYISELSYATLDDYPDLDKWWERYGGWHEGYTDKAQADWARYAMTIAFSKPYVNGVQWVGADDGPTDYDFVGVGLFHKDDVTPRPVLYAIGDLIKSWTTKGNGVTDDNGSLAFRGYGGDYELTVTTQDGRVFHTRTHVTEGQNNLLNLTVDTTPPVLKSVSTEPTVVKNGDALEIRVNAGEVDLAVMADVSQLDFTKTVPILLKQEPDGIYKGSVTISLGNNATNGIKTLTVNAKDSWGNVGTAAIEVELNNPAPVLDPMPPDDNFEGTVLNGAKWYPQISGGGTIRQNGRLIVSTGNTQVNSSVLINSVWVFTGDFDVQVDFQIGEGWSQPASGHIDGATLGVNIDGKSYHITRLRRDEGSGDDVLFAWSTSGILKGEIPSTILTGKYRLIRSGTTLVLLYDFGEGWKEFKSVAVPPSLAQVYLGNGSINASQAFTTYFDNFHINSGFTTYRP